MRAYRSDDDHEVKVCCLFVLFVYLLIKYILQ